MKGYGGIPRSELFERLWELQEKGHGVLVQLPSDDGVCLRLVVDEALTEQWEDYGESDEYEDLLDRFDGVDNPPFVEFLAHFTKIEDEANFKPNRDWLAESQFFGHKEMWMAFTIRRPKICPIGIKSQF